MSVFKSNLKLDAKIFNKAERKRAFSNLPMRSAREMRKSLKKKQLDGKPSGRIETVGRGRGFQRRFQRSRRGERPANETMTLNNAYSAKRTGDNSAIVEIEDKINPNNGESARDYAERLQKMGRLVMTEEDVAEAEEDFITRGKETLRDLLT